MSTPKHVYEVYIRTTPEKLWQAITSADATRQYYQRGLAVDSAWQPGQPICYRSPDGKAWVEGELLEVDPPRRLSHTFIGLFADPQRAERPSRVTWEIEQQGDVCRLTLVHDDFEGETETYGGVAHGWPVILSGLKTLLETGEPLGVA
jgi:uncharacterized protein YndB with AHSA1/START domain